jgi:hypothetical protein
MHFLLTILLQAQPAEPPKVPDLPVSIERIRKRLETSEVTIHQADPNLPPLFRVEVKDGLPPFEHLWREDSITPTYVRPSRGLVHHEFLEQVTPDLFRGTALHPCCDVLPALGFIHDKLRQAGRKYAEYRARREVRKALEEFMRAREEEKDR